MRATDGHAETGLAATGAAFTLQGGVYSFQAIVTSHSGLTANFAILGPDGSTYQNMITGLTASSTTTATAPFYLPPGSYKFVVTGTPGGGESWAFAITRVPFE